MIRRNFRYLPITLTLLAGLAIISGIILAGCDVNIDREHFIITIEKSPYIRTIGFEAGKNTTYDLKADSFSSPEGTDEKTKKELVRVLIPNAVTNLKNLTVTFTLSSDLPTLSVWNGTNWEQLQSGKSALTFSSLTDEKDLQVKLINPLTEKVRTRDYTLRLYKPIWIDLMNTKLDTSDTARNITLYLQLGDEKGYPLNGDRLVDSTWNAPMDEYLVYDPARMEILNYPPIYDTTGWFPLTVRPFENSDSLSLEIKEAVFVDVNGATSKAATIRFPFHADWIGSSYDVTFNANGGGTFVDNSGESITHQYVYGKTIDTFPEVKRDNDKLDDKPVGWFYDNGIYLRQFKKGESRVLGATTLYAKWNTDEAPEEPTNLVVVPGNKQISLSWWPPSYWGKESTFLTPRPAVKVTFLPSHS